MFVHSVNISWRLLYAWHCSSKIASPCRIGEDAVEQLAQGPARGQDQDMIAAGGDGWLPVLEPGADLGDMVSAPVGVWSWKEDRCTDRQWQHRVLGVLCSRGTRSAEKRRKATKASEGQEEHQRVCSGGRGRWIRQAEHTGRRIWGPRSFHPLPLLLARSEFQEIHRFLSGCGWDCCSSGGNALPNNEMLENSS